MPESISEIGSYAFSKCTGLKNAVISNAVCTMSEGIFEGCTSLKSVKLPTRLTNIKEEAFADCTSLSDIIIPEGVTEIGESVFSNCCDLEKIGIPKNVKTIGNEAFLSCSKLESIELSDELSSIGDMAFYGCTGMRNLKIGENVSVIGNEAFCGCSSLETISVEPANKTYYSGGNCLIKREGKILIQGCQNSQIPNGVKKIDFAAFSGCIGLKSINIPSSVNEIKIAGIWDPPGGYAAYSNTGFVPAFSGCSNLEEITVDDNNESYSSEGNCLLAENGKKLILGCKNSVIPESVTYVDEDAFCDNESIINIEIPESVQKINRFAFYGCINLSNILGYTNSYAEEFAKENNIPFEAIDNIYKFSYEDVDASSWYYESVKNAGQMGLINGVDEAHFKPDANMTYAQAITLAARMHQKYMTGCVTLENGSGNEAWYKPYVDYCVENHIIKGDYFGGINLGDNTGDSGDNLGGDSDDYSDIMNDTIDRQNYAEIFANALPDEAFAEKNTISDRAIPDVATGNPHYASIYKLYRAGICNGSDASGNFYPEKSIKRSEVAAILVRMMDESARVGAAV